jgi:hypothetical protein
MGNAFVLLFWLPLGTPRIANNPLVETVSNQEIKHFTVQQFD